MLLTLFVSAIAGITLEYIVKRSRDSNYQMRGRDTTGNQSVRSSPVQFF